MITIEEDGVLVLLDEIDNEKEKLRSYISTDICDRIDDLLEEIRIILSAEEVEGGEEVGSAVTGEAGEEVSS